MHLKFDTFQKIKTISQIYPEKIETLTKQELNNFIPTLRKEHEYGNFTICSDPSVYRRTLYF